MAEVLANGVTVALYRKADANHAPITPRATVHFGVEAFSRIIPRRRFRSFPAAVVSAPAGWGLSPNAAWARWVQRPGLTWSARSIDAGVTAPAGHR